MVHVDLTDDLSDDKAIADLDSSIQMVSKVCTEMLKQSVEILCLYAGSAGYIPTKGFCVCHAR